MTKIKALKGISNIFQKKHPTPPHKRKREHPWVDVSEDDLEVRSAKRPLSSSSKASHYSENGPRKKPRMSAPASLPMPKESIQQQRRQLPIYAGTRSLSATQVGL